MRKLNVPITIGKDENNNPIVKMSEENIYEIKELSYLGKLLSCKESKKRGITYLEIPCAFDIETTNIYKRDKDGKVLSVVHLKQRYNRVLPIENIILTISEADLRLIH